MRKLDGWWPPSVLPGAAFEKWGVQQSFSFSMEHDYGNYKRWMVLLTDDLWYEVTWDGKDGWIICWDGGLQADTGEEAALRYQLKQARLRLHHEVEKLKEVEAKVNEVSDRLDRYLSSREKSGGEG